MKSSILEKRKELNNLFKISFDQNILSSLEIIGGFIQLDLHSRCIFNYTTLRSIFSYS